MRKMHDLTFAQLQLLTYLKDYAETIGYSTVNPDLEVSAFGSPGYSGMDPNRYQVLCDSCGPVIICTPVNFTSEIILATVCRSIWLCAA